MGNYHPLTMLSLNLNYHMLAGDDFDKEGKVKNPFVFQLTNVVLHIINTVLVFFVIQLLFRNFSISLITSLFFGIHPLHVEYVTWIAERKDVLYAAFFLSSLIFYLKYIHKNNARNFIFSFCFFLLSALSKGQAVSLAVTLVAVDYLKGRKLLNLKLIAEKTLFIAAGFVFGIIAISAQKEGTALYSGFDKIIKRMLCASWGFLQYFFKLLVPVNLSAFYPYPDLVNRTIPAYYASGLILIGLIIWALLYLYNKSKGITFALAFYLINIALLLQLIPVGEAIMADRYVYIPSIGFFILLGLLYESLLEKKTVSLKILAGIIVLIAAFWGYATYERTQVWKDSLTLWNDVLKKQPGAATAWHNRGCAYNVKADEMKEENNYKQYAAYKLQTMADFTTAIEVDPYYKPAFYSRGAAKLEYGETVKDASYITSAIEDLDTALKIYLDFSIAFKQNFSSYELSDVFLKRAAAFQYLGHFEKALSDYDTLIQMNPRDFELYINRGIIKGRMGDFKAAIEDFNFAVQNLPNNASAYSNRGLTNDRLGNWQQAVEDYDKAISLDGNNYSAYFSRALMKYKLNKKQEAIDDLSIILKHEPENILALNTRGAYYLELNSVKNACGDFLAAARLNDNDAKMHVQEHCR